MTGFLSFLCPREWVSMQELIPTLDGKIRIIK